MDEKRREN